MRNRIVSLRALTTLRNLISRKKYAWLSPPSQNNIPLYGHLWRSSRQIINISLTGRYLPLKISTTNQRLQTSLWCATVPPEWYYVRLLSILFIEAVYYGKIFVYIIYFISVRWTSYKNISSEGRGSLSPMYGILFVQRGFKSSNFYKKRVMSLALLLPRDFVDFDSQFLFEYDIQRAKHFNDFQVSQALQMFGVYSYRMPSPSKVV